jgi:hemolysin III
MDVVRVKPRLRGVSHQFAFFAALIAGAVLIATTSPGRARLAVTVFVVSLAWLLGVSALYHRPMWPPATRARLKRLDHASIFLLIAGTYTPFCVLALPGPDGQALLVGVWVAAIVGAVVVVAWPGRPRTLSSVIYVAIGLAALFDIRAIHAALGAWAFTLFALGGVLYITGAVIYALRRPNPSPAVFGYHEVFHALVVLACGLHFAAIALVARA